MGKHAQPRQPSRARRAAVVSGGTLLLCLGAAAPAMADIGPVPVPQPIDDTVDQLSDATGLPNPIETADDVAGDSTDTTTKTTKHSKHKHGAARVSTSTLTADETTSPQRHPAKRQQPTAVTPASYTYGGLRGVPMTTSAPLVEAGRAPVTAGAVSGDTAVLAAGSAPTLVKPSADLLDGAGGQEGPRVLLIGLAAMVVGGLSAGHIKVAQDRLAQIISS